MSFESGAPVGLSQLLPTQRNLSALLDKLLTVFGAESILDGRKLPSQPLQRETGDVPRWALRPMVGNDFHIQTSFSCSHFWKALMQLEQDDEKSDKICLPLCDITIAQGPKSKDMTTAARLAQLEQMVKLLRSAWPDENVDGPSKRRQLGPPFASPDLPDYQIFRWLASKDLNPLSEGISLTHLLLDFQVEDRLIQPLRQRSVCFFFL
ncbi:hypothetical protein N658DRAFT_500735 [Parathielavia hyrcaniae]|uniref:Uncharacterized protein n=1 Tax=Parathielavia hyrcaniae TaxID=113614 RepID=A0AAN6SY10_9PEZI|nr:hypothetical protein N658DRAFT_500735 [Parathielavia hyrcaniae]